jgi:hypothetical protein
MGKGTGSVLTTFARNIEQSWKSLKEGTRKVWPKIVAVKNNIEWAYEQYSEGRKYWNEMKSDVQNVIGEIPFDSIRNPLEDAVGTFFGVTDQASNAADKYLDRGREMLNRFDDADWMMKATGLGYERASIDVEHGKRLARRLMDDYGYDYDEARLKAFHFLSTNEERAHKHLQKYSNLASEHYQHFADLYDSATHAMKENPFYQGGQHTYPPHGNTLVGNTRSNLDSAFGARSVYLPYLPEGDLVDKVSEATKNYISSDDQRTRIQQLQQFVADENPWLTQSFY